MYSSKVCHNAIGSSKSFSNVLDMIVALKLRYSNELLNIVH